MAKFRLWKNVEGNDRDPKKSWKFQSSIGNIVRYFVKDTVTPHFLNVVIRCIVLIKTALSQARHPAPPSSLFFVINWFERVSTSP